MSDQDQTEYLEPSLLLGTSFKDLMEELKKYGSLMGMFGDEKRTAPDDLLQQDFIFVVGEPGQGKSRLLRELSTRAVTKGMNATVLDLCQAPFFCNTLSLSGVAGMRLAA